MIRYSLVVKCCVILAVLLTAGCAPTIRLETPREPITINLNIKLDADVRLWLEEKAKDDIEDNPEIF